MNVAFCINRLGLAGLGATVASLIENCSDSGKLKIWFMCVDFSGKEKESINRLLQYKGFLGWHTFIDFEPKDTFGTFNGLHGDWTSYGRLLIQHYIHEDRVLYLDADLIVELDVLALENFDFQGLNLAAVGGGKVRYTLGSEFYTDVVGLHPDQEYFNAGVLLLNLSEWRRQNILDKCLQVAAQYPQLPSHDQSLLNIICRGNFAKLPPSYNCEWLAAENRPCAASHMIVHFVGSPKPWDLLGSVVHNGYSLWRQYTTTEWIKTYGGFSHENVNRAWNIRRSYMRTIRNRIRNRRLKASASLSQA